MTIRLIRGGAPARHIGEGGGGEREKAAPSGAVMGDDAICGRRLAATLSFQLEPWPPRRSVSQLHHTEGEIGIEAYETD